MTATKTISAVIPFFGNPVDTMPLIDQLRAQTRPADEIIVADDCSPTPFPALAGLTVVRRQSNGGFGSAVNTGVATATGDYVLILNSDLTLSPTFIADLLASAQQLPPSVLSPRVVEHGRGAATAREWPTVRGSFFSWLTPFARWRSTFLWRRLVGHNDPDSISTEPVDWVVGACMLIPTAALRAVGGFDERFFMNSEEIDVQRRLTAAGVSSRLVPSVAVEHASGGSSDPLRRRQWLVDGMFIYFEKWGDAHRLRAALLVATALNQAWNTTRQWRGVDVDPRRTAAEERALVKHGYAARHGKATS